MALRAIAGGGAGVFTGDNPVTGRTAAGNAGLTIRSNTASNTEAAIYPTILTPSASNYALGVNPAGNTVRLNGTSIVELCISSIPSLSLTSISVNTIVPLKISDGYTVATLPTGAVGRRAYVTDALAPTFLGALTGGGAVVCPVFHNGTAWVAG